jgi:ABC-type transporter Mla subunit MlaD
MSSNRNNLLAGVLVTIAIVGSVVAIIVLAGGAEQLGRRSYIVTFDLATGVSGLTPGAEVSIGGKKVGAVQKNEFVQNDDGVVSGIDITIGIDKSITLRDGARPYLELPLLGSQSKINFPSVGEGAIIEPGSRMRGTLAPPAFLSQAGYGDDQAHQLQSILKNTDEAMAKLNAGADDVRLITSDAATKWPDWSTRIDSITEKADATLSKGPEIAEDIQARLDQIEEVLATTKGYLDENRENVKSAIASFKSIGEKGDEFAARLNGEIKDAALAMLEKGKSTLDDAQTFLARLSEIVGEQRPNIRKTFANIRLAADQLRDTLIEVRRSPWRLIYRPDTRELNFELLYDSARSYAGAVSDLRAASESLESLIASGPDPQLLRAGSVDELLAEVQRAMDSYKQAEQRFMDHLLADPAPTDGGK